MRPHTSEAEELAAAIERGEEVDPFRLIRVLRRHECPRSLVEAVCTSVRLLRDRRLLTLVVRHPACPQRVAWDGLPRLLWRDLHEVCRDPRTPPAVKAQAERRLSERVSNLTLGERTALAKIATRGVISTLMNQEEPRCIRALLDNPMLTELDALRLLSCNRSRSCLQEVLRHTRWGRDPALVRVAVRLPHLPLAQALGLVVSLTDHELEDLASSSDVREDLRAAASDLLQHRMLAKRSSDPTPP
jgi:hypothetical protein